MVSFLLLFSCFLPFVLMHVNNPSSTIICTDGNCLVVSSSIAYCSRVKFVRVCIYPICRRLITNRLLNNFNFDMFLIELDGYAIHIHSGYSIWASIRQVISKICLLLVSICTKVGINVKWFIDSIWSFIFFLFWLFPYMLAWLP